MTIRMTRQRQHVRLSLPAIFIVVAASLGANAIGSPTTASAEPREWDVVATDNCVAYALELYQEGKITFQKYNEYVKNCCEVYGGIWSNSQGCVAPPANASDPRRWPSRIPTQTLEPDAPLVAVG